MTTQPGDAPPTRCARTAFLILAHAHPDRVRALVDSLSAPWSQIFVHIDRKVSLAHFATALAGTSATLLDGRERASVNWGGFGVVQATLALIARARKSMPDVQRYCLLSGADLPVRSLDTIGRALATDVEYMKVVKALRVGGPSIHDDYVTFPSVADLWMCNPRAGSEIIAKLADRIRRTVKRTPPDGIVFYQASCWWCLTSHAIDAILAAIDDRPETLRWFRWCAIPDEIFFATMLKATSFSARISDDRTASVSGPDENLVHGAHYIDWKHPNPALPRVLDQDDFDRVVESSALFARKVDPNRSKAFIEMVEEHVKRVGSKDAQ